GARPGVADRAPLARRGRGRARAPPLPAGGGAGAGGRRPRERGAVAGPGAAPRHGRAAGARRRAAGRPARGRRRLARRSARAPPRAGNGLPTPFLRPLHRLREPPPEPLAPPCDFTGASEEKTHASPASPPRPWWQRGAAPLAARRVARAAGPGRAPDSLHYRLEPHDAVAGPDARWGRAPGRRRRRLL